MDDAHTLYLWRWRDEHSRWYPGKRTTEDEHEAWLAARIDNPLVELLTAESDGKLVGCARVDSNGEVTVTVAPRERRKGYGTQILLAVLALSKVKLKTTIDIENQAAIALADKAGFKEGGALFFSWRP